MRLACGSCGWKMSVIPGQVASAVPPERLTALQNMLGRVRDPDGFAFGLADGGGHLRAFVVRRISTSLPW
jgi:hypothetical protein